MKVFTTIGAIILFIILFIVFGNAILEEFPQLQPIWEEFIIHVQNFYQWVSMEYGAMLTFAIIAILLFLIFGSKR